MRVIVRGAASGPILRSEMPINFLGTVDKRTGEVTNSAHDLHGRSFKDRILVFPRGAGSSVGAYTIYSLASRGLAPAAMVCKKADLVVASGCALANIPLYVADGAEYDSLEDGARLRLPG